MNRIIIIAIIAIIVSAAVIGGYSWYNNHESAKKVTGTETGVPNLDSTKQAQPNSDPKLKKITAMFDNIAIIETGDTIDLVKIDRMTRIGFFMRFTGQKKDVFAMVDYNLFSAEGWKVAIQLYRSKNQRSQDWQNADIDDLQTGQSQLASDVEKLKRENSRLRNRVKKLETSSPSDGAPDQAPNDVSPGQGRDDDGLN